MTVNILVLLIALTICLLCAIAYRWGFADGSRVAPLSVGLHPGESVEIRAVHSDTTLQIVRK